MWQRKQDTRALLQIRNASFTANLAASRFESERKKLGMNNLSDRFVCNSWIISQHSSWGSIAKHRSSIKSRGRLCVHSGIHKNQVTAKKNLKPCVTCNDSLWTENKANCLRLRDPSNVAHSDENKYIIRLSIISSSSRAWFRAPKCGKKMIGGFFLQPAGF